MTPLRHPDLRWQRLRALGRLGAAVAAGGAFAALSWNSVPPPDDTAGGNAVEKDSQTAEQRSVVKEDDGAPQLSARDPAAHGDSPWGLSQTQTRPQARPVSGLRPDQPTGDSYKVYRDIDLAENSTAPTTAVRHSRAPP